jgi:anhydro-N-acetylmuramic acid kinase
MQINNKLNSTILITGGGVYNLYLIHRIKDFTTNTIIIPTKNLIEYKEALIFGLLGVLKLRGENNCLQSVTGADKDHSSGYIYYY